MTACPISPYNPRLCFAVDNSGQLGCETLTYVAATRSTFRIDRNVSHAQMLQFVLLLLSLAHKSKSHAPVVKLPTTPPPHPLVFTVFAKNFTFCRKPVMCSTVCGIYYIMVYIIRQGL